MLWDAFLQKGQSNRSELIVSCSELNTPQSWKKTFNMLKPLRLGWSLPSSRAMTLYIQPELKQKGLKSRNTFARHSTY